VSRAAHALLQQRRDLAQELVAGRVAAGVVDELELVEVDVHQRVHALLGMREAQRVVQARLEVGAVDEPGERVVRRPVAHLACHAALVADVAEDEHRAQHPAVHGEDRRDGLLDRGLVALAARERRERPGRCALRRLGVRHATGRMRPVDEAGRHRIRQRRARDLVDAAVDLVERACPRLGVAPAGEPLGDRIEVLHAAGVVRRDHRIADRVQRDAQLLVLRADLVLRARRSVMSSVMVANCSGAGRYATTENQRPYFGEWRSKVVVSPRRATRAKVSIQARHSGPRAGNSSDERAPSIRSGSKPIILRAPC
jgi:hypothetical protein